MHVLFFDWHLAQSQYAISNAALPLPFSVPGRTETDLPRRRSEQVAQFYAGQESLDLMLEEHGTALPRGCSTDLRLVLGACLQCLGHRSAEGRVRMRRTEHKREAMLQAPLVGFRLVREGLRWVLNAAKCSVKALLS